MVCTKDCAAIFAAATVLLVAERGSATVVNALTLAEKTRVAPVIVHARVERVESRWEIPNERIETLVSLRVIEDIKGDTENGTLVTLRQSGGEIDGVRAAPIGMSTYTVGEEVIVFLEPLGPHLIEIGIGIAKYSIEHSRGERIVSHAPNVAGVRRPERGEGPTRIEALSPMEPERLSTFLLRLKSLVGGGSRRSGDVITTPIREVAVEAATPRD
jgi:hypothetical protein